MGLHKESMYMTGKPEGTGNVRGLAGHRLLQLLVGTAGATRRHTTSKSSYTFHTGRMGKRPWAWKKTERRHILFSAPQIV